LQRPSTNLRQRQVPKNYPFLVGDHFLSGGPVSHRLDFYLALVAVNTSLSFAHRSGHLAVIDLNQRTILAIIDLGGQPD
jgi:hypothetical protein